MKTFLFIFFLSVQFLFSADRSTMFTMLSPIRDNKGESTVLIMSTPAFCQTPAASTQITPAQLFPAVQPNSPSSMHFCTPDYKRHFSTFSFDLTPVPVINESNKSRWLGPDDTYSSASSASSESLSLIHI